MDTYNAKENIRHILQEFQKYDVLHAKFQSDFELDVYNMIADHATDVMLKDDFPTDIKTFSNTLINCAYEVLEKNSSYPDYRMEMELENMDALLKHYPKPEKHTEFTKHFSHIVKEKMPEYFSELYDLSANGFRLLERCINARINSFLIHLFKTE